MRTLPVEFTRKKVSPWGGIHLFHSVYQKSGLRQVLGNLPLPKPGSNRGYDPVDIVESFMVSVILGSRRLAHSGMLRSDEIIREIFGWKSGSPSSSTFSRFFKKFNRTMNDNIFPIAQKHLFDQVDIKKMTIDIDSTVITRYGDQEYAKKGYNKGKKGKVSHHPLIAFCDELKMVVNAWMRSGDSGSSTDMEGFIDELLTIVDKQKIGLLRMDSGFYSGSIMRQLEGDKEPLNYLIKARLTGRLKNAIYGVEDWHCPSEKVSNYEYAEIEYQGVNWTKARRFIICRKRKRTSTEKQELFEELQQKESYDYHAFVTNTDQSCELIHLIYNKRGDCENLIKELKYDYSIDGFALQNFYAMEAAFRMIMICYNLMKILKQKAITSKYSHRLSTIKFQCIALGSFIVKDGRNKLLKISAEGKRRHFLQKIFDNVELIPPNFRISNA